MIEDNLYLIQLTVYQYSETKTKMDYSFIPITFSKKESGYPVQAKSEVSEETIDLSRFKFDKCFFKMSTNIRSKSTVYIASKFSKKKEGKACKIDMIVSTPNIEKDEKMICGWVVKDFKNHFWARRKYLKFLNKKENLKQLPL